MTRLLDDPEMHDLAYIWGSAAVLGGLMMLFFIWLAFYEFRKGNKGDSFGAGGMALAALTQFTLAVVILLKLYGIQVL